MSNMRLNIEDIIHDFVPLGYPLKYKKIMVMHIFLWIEGVNMWISPWMHRIRSCLSTEFGKKLWTMWKMVASAYRSRSVGDIA